MLIAPVAGAGREDRTSAGPPGWDRGGGLAGPDGRSSRSTRGAAVVVGATVVVVAGTFVVGSGVTGTALACGAPSGGVVVVDAATW